MTVTDRRYACSAWDWNVRVMYRCETRFNRHVWLEWDYAQNKRTRATETSWQGNRKQRRRWRTSV